MDKKPTPPDMEKATSSTATSTPGKPHSGNREDKPTPPSTTDKRPSGHLVKTPTFSPPTLGNSCWICDLEQWAGTR